MPCNTVPVQTVNSKALAARVCGILAPEVVVDGVRSCLDRVPLAAGVGTLLDGCRYSGSQSNERGGGDGGRVLHFEDGVVQRGMWWSEVDVKGARQAPGLRRFAEV